MNMSIQYPLNSKSRHLTPEEIQQFGAKVDAIRREVMDSLGEKDAAYIYKSATSSVIVKLLHVAC